MEEIDFVLGIDVSKSTLDAELLGLSTPRRAQFANTTKGFEKLGKWLGRWKAGRVHACMEATGSYSEAVAEWLVEHGHVASVVNPLRVKAYGQSELVRTKTDRVDAGVIARFCRAQRPEAWRPPSREQRELRALVRRLESLEEMRRAEVNRLEGADGVVRPSIERHVAYLDEQIEQTERAIDEHVDGSGELKRQCELLESIPGVGRRTAARLLAEMEKIVEYESSREAAAAAGLVPRERQSGASVRGRARMSKVGSRRVRELLYFPAIVAMTHNPVIRALKQRLAERGKTAMVIVGAAMRKLLVLCYGVLKSGEPFDPKRVARA
jgi:transposase